MPDHDPTTLTLSGDILGQLLYVGDAAHRLLAMQDRDPLSPSYGSFHCAYWRDKTSEFADARFQEAGATLGLLTHPALKALGIARGWPATGELREACHAGLTNLQRLQYAEGCYDEWYKGERGFAATAFTTFAYAACATHLGEAMAPETRALLPTVLAPAGDWLLRHDDLVKANHEIVAAAALAVLFQATGEHRWRDGAMNKMAKSLAVQTKEGWFPELRGMDLGYSALILDYMMAYHAVLPEEPLIGSACALLDFMLPHLHPDLTFAAEAGTCRNAYAGQIGYLLLAPHHAGARAIAGRLTEGGALAKRIQAYLGDDLRLARWSCLPVIGALTMLAGSTPGPGIIPYPQGWTIHKQAGMAAWHQGDVHLYAPYAGGAVTRVYLGNVAVLQDVGVDLVTDRGALGAAGYDTDRLEAVSGEAITFQVGFVKPKYFFPGFLQRLLLRVGSLTARSSRLTRAVIDYYRQSVKTAINQSSASVGTGGTGFRIRRTIAIAATHITITDRIEGAAGFCVRNRWRGSNAWEPGPLPAEGAMTLQKTISIATGSIQKDIA